ncbi:MAG: RDD family protein [Candidatus Sulfotelmatobacter sp.]
MEAASELSGEARKSGEHDGAAWRQEVAARLNRYQSRRKPRPPRYPSLRLRFAGNENNEESERNDSANANRPIPAQPLDAQTSQQTSRSALAFDGFAERADEFAAAASEFVSWAVTNSRETQPVPNANAGASAKIIEFPRIWNPPARPVDELAEPVMTAPRILEVPEFVPPPPALGGITIEKLSPVEIERRPGIDFPLQSASLGRRISAAAIDSALVAAASFAFGFIFWKMTGLRPPRLQIIEMAGGFGALFWAAYQYLLIVYSNGTPGLRLARLELGRFDGTRANRRLRRWRVLASFLSAASLGMGYAWVFLDEDALCWHDRITHTYLAPKAATNEQN